jgi:hypothetical protein
MRRAVIDEPATREQVVAVLLAEYDSARSFDGFRYRQRPSHVGVYVFSSDDRAESGEGLWLAMLFTTEPIDSLPAIEFNDELFVNAWAPPNERFGLSEQTRRELLSEIVHAEDRARRDAATKHPRDPAAANMAAHDLRSTYLEELARSHGVGVDTLYAIIGESMTKGWPLPKERETPRRQQ